MAHANGSGRTAIFVLLRKGSPLPGAVPGDADQLREVAGVELRHDAGLVDLDGSRADGKPRRHVLVVQAEDDQLQDLEKRLILNALVQTGHNRSQAARLLGIKRSTLGDRIQRLRLSERLGEEVA